ncbi:MAG: bifunctional methylenetetrahydrofolate dehydrogenase/methenyltetrahydrofolate cyclohydrolase FolD [Lachnospiraceae bacterium]|jgi:methylenetetrahydrofolate dehydrogenase (NADP+)/methenyltetrahydrofolate cyclohydrolase|nr:bifunctional methylenetetrahydrofolate dehydrogenase/methenyltetrahydrofolate cyclohydrolase FolD [Lachnospiraceae bacterium]
MPKILDGKKVAEEIRNEVKLEVSELRKKGINITLAVIQVGDNPASSVYVKNKRRDCERCNIDSKSYELPEDVSQGELLSLIEDLNNDTDVNGILVQLPLPAHINEQLVIESISPIKDVDGFHPENLGRLVIGDDGFVPCTPAGIIELLKRSGIDIAKKECVVIGRSNIVGKPLAMLLLRENGTVTVAHSKTRYLKRVCKRADILIAAIGKQELIDKSYLKKGAVVVDVGINRNDLGKLVGDVNFGDVSDTVSAISPVPGGVGPMTRAMLLVNCIKATKIQEGTM